MANYPRQDRKIGLRKERIQGRDVTVYEPTLALQIVERVAEGELLKDICTVANKMPARSTFLKWVAREPTLRKAYAAAKELSALAFEEAAISAAYDIAHKPGTAQNVAAARTLIDQLRWSSTRRDPKNYSERGTMTQVVPVHIETTLNLGDGMKNVEDAYTIDLTAEEEKPIVEKGARAPMKRQLTPRMPMEVESVKEELEKRKSPFTTLEDIANARTV